MTSQEKAFREFARFVGGLKGDEKSEAQTFLFHLLEAFGHNANTLPEGCTFEYRVRFSGDPRPAKNQKPASLPPADGESVRQRGNSVDRTKFADLVWPGRC